MRTTFIHVCVFLCVLLYYDTCAHFKRIANTRIFGNRGFLRSDYETGVSLCLSLFSRKSFVFDKGKYKLDSNVAIWPKLTHSII